MYLETGQGYIRTERYKFVYSTGKRRDWYRPARPVTARPRRLSDWQRDPEEFHGSAARHAGRVRRFEDPLLKRFRASHPDAGSEPGGLGAQDALDFHLRRRDAV
ncbi:MAG TPA: hypothetical protein VGS58_01055 [Candidatus Sulfopaludibacter sp.]|nr:hypothetical protein [Candidatus Sulfopaludibacter sp.]